MPIAKININSYIGVPITKGVIDFEITQLKAYQKKAESRPEFLPYVYEIQKEIDLMQRELDNQ